MSTSRAYLKGHRRMISKSAYPVVVHHHHRAWFSFERHFRMLLWQLQFCKDFLNPLQLVWSEDYCFDSCCCPWPCWQCWWYDADDAYALFLLWWWVMKGSFLDLCCSVLLLAPLSLWVPTYFYIAMTRSNDKQWKQINIRYVLYENENGRIILQIDRR